MMTLLLDIKLFSREFLEFICSFYYIEFYFISDIDEDLLWTLSNISLVWEADRQNRIRLFSRGTAGKAATVTPIPCSKQQREKYLYKYQMSLSLRKQFHAYIKRPSIANRILQLSKTLLFTKFILCVHTVYSTHTTLAGEKVTIGTTGESLFPYTIKPISCSRLLKYLVFHFS